MTFRPRENPAPYQIWGENLDSTARPSDEERVPAAGGGGRGADAGRARGVRAADRRRAGDGEAVIPYAVGVDIACRMKMTCSTSRCQRAGDREGASGKAIERETRFGIGASLENAASTT